jgi:hypothetical protein
MRALPLLLSVALLPACAEKPARVELEPNALRFGVRGQTAKVHASPLRRDGRRVPENRCAWSSSDETVATVSGPHNDAVVTAVGPGSATVRCAIGDLVAELAVSVRVVSRVTVRPAEVVLRLADEPAPLALEVQAFDDAGAPVLGRVVHTRCEDEAVCRGDARGQLWATGPGKSVAVVEVEGARAELAVRVVEARSAEARPQRVTGNPMDAIEREVRAKEAAEAKKRAP